ncbi:MAG: DUF1549 domain-containing protein [Planctomycetaceae bacterium]
MLVRFSVCVSFLLSLLCTSSLHSAEKPTQAELDFFEKKIRPVLVKHCYACHSTKSKNIRGGLLLDSRAGLLKGGETGPAVVPGKPGKSLLIGALKHEDFEMPPDRKLAPAVIADFEKWIRRGAADPRIGKAHLPKKRSIDLEKGRQFWAFRPLTSPVPPQIENASSSVTPIDRFLQARLAKHNLKPAPVAAKQTLIRRLSYDLIGLPPTPEQIRQFVDDRSPKAYEKLVDRLLASRHFGERWGRHWLDVVRFAESSGGGRTQIYHLAWKYRDYVIASMNADKPFNQFVVEQIAGDLLPWKTPRQRRDQLIATGYLMLGPTNYELQDKELLRMEVVDEQLDTLGRTFLGMTIGCARCHDHKFDPIPNEDYYALAGILRSTHVLTPGNVSGYVKRPLPTNAEQAKLLAEYERKTTPVKNEIAEIRERIRRLKQQQAGMVVTSISAKSLPGIVLDDTQAELAGKWGASSSVQRFVGAGYRYGSGSKVLARYRFKVPTAGKYEVRISHNAHPNRALNTPVSIRFSQMQIQKRVNQRKRPPIEDLWVSLGTYSFSKGESVTVEVSGKGANGSVIADAVQLLPINQRRVVTSRKKTPSKESPKSSAREALTARIKKETEQLKSLEAKLKTLKKDAPPPAPLAMAVEDETKTGDYFVCIRGNVHKLGKKVPRGFLSVISDNPSVRISKSESGRRELAAWLASEKNPLTPRVYVNRVWHHLFGAGLVRTVDNFGAMGERPSHPQLLDYLASHFIKRNWSTKSLIRQIVMTRAYRQSTQHNSAAAKIDPENRLLWRQNRRRLDAEAIRDTILSVSGQLDLTPGGPSLSPKVKSEFGFKHTSLRRSVYVPVLRNTLHEIFEVFDFADPNMVVGKRNASTLPTQALYLMNSPFVMQQASLAANRLLKNEALKPTSRIEYAYQLTLGRSPTPAESRLVKKYLASQIERPKNSEKAPGSTLQQVNMKSAWAGVFQALFSCVDFRYID